MPDSFSGIFKSTLKNNPDYVLIGLPYDAGSSYRSGCRLGPEAIRRYAVSINSCTERGLDLSNLNARDDGDLALNNRVDDAFSAMKTKVAGIMDERAVPIVLGGDHSITMPCIEAAFNKYPNLNVLYFDAHPDLYADYDGDPQSHACVMARALDFGIAGSNITQVGIRASTPMQKEIAEREKMRTIPIWEIEGFQYQSDQPVYVSFDIDVLDPAHAPGCGNPVPGGLSFRQAIGLIQNIEAPIVGLDVVEVNPLLDPSGITSLAAARVIVEFLGKMSQTSA
jgi:agmatinase